MDECKQIVVDDDDHEVEVDAKGRTRPAMQLKHSKQASGFTYFDSDQGHCCFCGSLTCNGGCFK